MSGRLKSAAPVRLHVQGLSRSGRFYANGVAIPSATTTRGTLDVSLPAGEYRWECTTGKPAPMPARITDTEYETGRVKLHIARTSPCDAVIVQISTDGGKTWTDQGRTTGDTYYLPQGAEGKVHVRALAVNGNRTAAETFEYPVYFTHKRPHHPDGLWLRTDSNQVSLSWGQVLGTQVYRLYRREAGTDEYTLVYEGRERHFTDREAAGARQAFHLPGTQDNRTTSRKGLRVYEYAVTAVNAHGESEKSPAESTDPASWRNWYPDTELKFKRRSAFWMQPYVPTDWMPEAYYPE